MVPPQWTADIRAHTENFAMLQNTPFIFVTQCMCRLLCICTILYHFYVCESYNLAAGKCVCVCVCVYVVTVVCTHLSIRFVHKNQSWQRERGHIKMSKKDHTLFIDHSLKPFAKQQFFHLQLSVHYGSFSYKFGGCWNFLPKKQK